MIVVVGGPSPTRHPDELTTSGRAAQEKLLCARPGTLAWSAGHAITHVSARGCGCGGGLRPFVLSIQISRRVIEKALGKATRCDADRQHERGIHQGGQTG
jgi:hypothetical protein